MKNKSMIEFRRKAPRISECIKFPRWKTKYYIKMYDGDFWFKGYDPVKDEPIYTNRHYGFLYESDARMMYFFASRILKERVFLQKVTFPCLDLERTFNPKHVKCAKSIRPKNPNKHGKDFSRI